MTWPQQQPPSDGSSTQRWLIGGLIAAVVVLVGVLAFVLGTAPVTTTAAPRPAAPRPR